MLGQDLISVFLTYLNPPNSDSCHHDNCCDDWTRILRVKISVIKPIEKQTGKKKFHLYGQIILNVVWTSSSVFYWVFLIIKSLISVFSILLSGRLFSKKNFCLLLWYFYANDISVLFHHSFPHTNPPTKTQRYASKTFSECKVMFDSYLFMHLST